MLIVDQITCPYNNYDRKPICFIPRINNDCTNFGLSTLVMELSY